MGTTVGTIDAYDPDGDPLTYGVASGGPWYTTHMSVDPDTGAVVLHFPPDYEFQQTYELEITISDGIDSTGVSLLVEVLDRYGATITGRITNQMSMVPENDPGVCDEAPVGEIDGYGYFFACNGGVAVATFIDGSFSIEIDEPGQYVLDYLQTGVDGWVAYPLERYGDYPVPDCEVPQWNQWVGSLPVIDVTADDIASRRLFDIGEYCFAGGWILDLLSPSRL